MHSLAEFVSAVSFVCLVLALARPRFFHWPKRGATGRQLSIGFGLVLILSSITAAATVPPVVPSNPVSPAQTTSTPKATEPPSPLVQRTKTSGCQIQGVLPDQSCTPGAAFASTESNRICIPGYSSSVRNVSQQLKDQVYAEYGITSHSAGQYEVDHLIPLELGGSNDIANLWPEPASPTPGFHQKDELENSLHTKVCSEGMALATAQAEIAANWLSAYRPAGGNAPQATPVPAQPQSAAPATSGVVKLSTNGICHAPGHAYYERTVHYTAYPTMDACVAAGGRPSSR